MICDLRKYQWELTYKRNDENIIEIYRISYFLNGEPINLKGFAGSEKQIDIDPIATNYRWETIGNEFLAYIGSDIFIFDARKKINQ